MSAQVLQQPSYTLTLSVQERDCLLGLLRQAFGESRVEAHRTHTPDFRDLVLDQQAVFRTLVDKVERLGPDRVGLSPEVPVGIEERALFDDLYVNDEGRFQMAAADLEDFIRFLRDHEVGVEVETADAFCSGGDAYGYGRLLHLYDVDSVITLYRTWKRAQGSRAAATATA